MSADRSTHVVFLTPLGRGAVATLLVEGPLAVLAVEKYFRPAARGKALGDFSCGRIVFGRWGGAAGEEMVATRIADEQIELSCHGGRLAAERIERDLVEAGCQAVEWSQWLVNESPISIEAEARMALAQARTQRTAAILLDQLQGALDKELSEIEKIADDDPEQACARLQVLIDRAPLGLHLVAPWRIVLAGPPNVGKSSLINALVGYARAIVFDQPGTTRDVVTASTAIDGWPVELADTAGLREGGDELEASGIARAREQMAAADVLVLVFDVTQPWTAEDASLLAQWPNAVVVCNKCDLPVWHLAPRGESRRGATWHTSATTRQGIEELIEALGRRLVPDPPAAGTAVPFTARQVRMIEELMRVRRQTPSAFGGW